jgi:Protein of unknown function (DUF3631)
MTGEGESIIARRKLLLGDIRDAFAKKGNAPISSAELVKTLIALEGRPWSKTSDPLTQIKLAQMLARMQIRPCCIGPEATRVRGYKITQFKEAFRRYLRKNGSKRADVPVMARTGGGEQGLSDLRIQEHAGWYLGRAFMQTRRSWPALDAELRAILDREVGPERGEVEFYRVVKMVRHQ